VKAEGGRVIWEAETPYQYARVIEDPAGERRLELNEGQAVHSLLPADRGVLTGNYWDEPLVLPAAVLGRPPRSIAILGGAAGTVARAYGQLYPTTRVDNVEIDGEMTDVGRRLFDLGGPNLYTHTADARPWLRRSDRRYDVIYVDAYRQPYIPFYLATREFFELARDRLTPGGAVIVNVGHPANSNELERALTATMRSALPEIARDAAQPTNTQLIASAAVEPTSDRLLETKLPRKLRALADAAAARLEPGLSGGEVWTDDRAPVEWLVDSSILEVAANGE
jgi:spermidine synthase